MPINPVGSTKGFGGEGINANTLTASPVGEIVVPGPLGRAAETGETDIEITRLEAERTLRTVLISTDEADSQLDRGIDYITKRENEVKIRLFDVAMEVIRDGDFVAVQEVSELVLTNSIAGEKLTPVLGKYGAIDGLEKTLRLIEIYREDSEVARLLVANRVAGFHCSRSGSLSGVLRHSALFNAKEAAKNGEIVTSGEQLFSPREGQRAISFADWRKPETIKQYSGIASNTLSVNELREAQSLAVKGAVQWERLYGRDHPWVYNSYRMAEQFGRQAVFLEENSDSAEAALITDNFSVAYGVCIDGFDRFPTVTDLPADASEYPKALIERVNSGIQGEFMVLDTAIEITQVPVIAVPREQIERVRSLLASHEINSHVIDIQIILGSSKP